MKSVLVVDDSLEVQILLHRIAGEECVLTSANRMAQARTLLASIKFDLVIVDLLLPDGSGLDLVADIRATWPDQKVVVLSGCITERIREEALESGANEVLDKSEPVSRIQRLLT